MTRYNMSKRWITIIVLCGQEWIFSCTSILMAVRPLKPWLMMQWMFSHFWVAYDLPPFPLILFSVTRRLAVHIYKKNQCMLESNLLRSQRGEAFHRWIHLFDPVGSDASILSYSGTNKWVQAHKWGQILLWVEIELCLPQVSQVDNLILTKVSPHLLYRSLP